MRWIFFALLVAGWCSIADAVRAQTPKDDLRRSIPKLDKKWAPLLTIPANADPATKWQTEKVRAILITIQEYRVLADRGTLYLVDLSMLEVARGLKETAMEMKEPKWKRELIREYVAILELVHSKAEAMFEAGLQSMPPQKYFYIRYAWAEAKLVQARVNKELEGK